MTLTLRLDAYSEEARQYIRAAQSLADDRGNPEVEPLHLLYRLVEQAKIAQQAVANAGIAPADLLVEAEAELRKLPKVDGAVAYLSPRTLDLLGRAEGEGARQGGIPIGVGHLLLATAQDRSPSVTRPLKACGLSAPILRATLDGGSVADDSRGAGNQRPLSGSGPAGGDPLEQFGQDLTRLASQGRFDPTVGRDAEMRRILQVLARRMENNPLLVGEAGTGRTSIIRGLAARIAKGDVPTSLHGKRIVELDFGAMVAGAKLRGQLEERMRSLLDAVRDSAGEVLLFVPDLGALIDDKSPTGAAGVVAAALGRGEVRSLAVCTPDEMRRANDSHSLLLRRFVPIFVEPPSVAEAVATLRGLVQRFEVAHGVRIGDPALLSAVNFARRYVPQVQLPKSAIDLIDESAARVRVETDSVPEELDALERRIENLEIQHASLEDDLDAESREIRRGLGDELEALRPKASEFRRQWAADLERLAEVRRLKEEISAAEREHEQSRTGTQSERTSELRVGTLATLQRHLADAEAALEQHGKGLVRDTVLPEDVADVVAAWTGVPVAKMLEEEAQKLLQMEARLRERVVGQNDAVAAVSRAVRRGRVGLRDPKRPIGSFLFLGPTGVGKTELAKALAEFLFDDEGSLTRLDMSEFMERHMVARLLGSPPGYVDSEEGGFLTEAVRKRPYSVVLFDEMEKAHQDVFNILLQVLDDGRLTDSRGRVALFSDTVIIMTSNVGGSAILDHANRNGESSRESLKGVVESELNSFFRPEFLNRVDDVVIFEQLSKEDLRGIVDIQLRGLEKLLQGRRLHLEVSDAAKDHLVELGYQPAYGARPLKRVILKNLQDPLAEEILRGGYAPTDTVVVDVKDGVFAFERRPLDAS